MPSSSRFPVADVAACWICPFNLYSEKKALEKLDYMHLSPVRAGLVEKAVDRAWSSARYFESGKSVGVPLEWIFS